MIIYDLQCEALHRFEGWFKNPDDYEQQLASGLLACPVCGSEQVRKVPSATYISKPSGGDVKGTVRELAALHQRSAELMRQLHDYVDKHYDDVGGGFAEEAKRMHYGETEERNIRGVASAEEVKELKEAGVAALPLPPRPIDKQKLN